MEKKGKKNTSELLYWWIHSLGPVLIKHITQPLLLLGYYLYVYLRLSNGFVSAEVNLCHLVTICPRSSDPFYTVSYYIKWVTILGHTVCMYVFVCTPRDHKSDHLRKINVFFCKCSKCKKDSPKLNQETKVLWDQGTIAEKSN